MSPGASGPGTPKSLQKVSGTVRKTLSALSGDFPDCSRDFLETFSRLSWHCRARRARETSVRGGLVRNLSGPLSRLNALLSLLHPFDRYRTPYGIGSAIGRPYLGLSRIHAHVGAINRLVLNRSGGSIA